MCGALPTRSAIPSSRKCHRQILCDVLVAGGWQVFFFSAKKEIVDALRPDIDAGRVDTLDLQALPVPGRGERAPVEKTGFGDLFV